MDSWWTWFSKFQDEQRLERLQQCRKLQDVLTQCEESSSSSINTNTTTTTTTTRTRTRKRNDDYPPNAMEEFSGGLRMMKYFGWRGILKDDENENNDEDGMTSTLPPKLRREMISSCARERHSVWACRAVAVGCGKELAALKKEFDEYGPLAILHESRTAYEYNDNTKRNITKTKKSKASSPIPASELQRTLGSCVQKGAQELLERQQQRQKWDAIPRQEKQEVSTDTTP